MNRIYGLAIFLLGCFSSGSAQLLQKANSDDFSKKPYCKIIGQEGSKVFFVKSTTSFNAKSAQIRLKDTKAELICMDTALHLIWNTTIDLSLYAEAEIEHILLFDTKLFVFFSGLDKEQNQAKLYYLPYLLTSGQPSGSPQVCDITPFEKRRDKSPFYIAQSKDLQQLAIFHREASEAGGLLDLDSKKDASKPNDSLAEHLSFRLFSGNMSQESGKQFQNVGYTGRQSIRDLGVDNAGNVFVLTAYRSSPGTPPYEYRLLELKKQGDKLLQYPIKLGDKSIIDLKIAVDNLNEQVAIGGFYSDNHSFASAGLVQAALSIRNDSLSKIHSELFKAKFLSDFSGDKTSNRVGELINYEVDKLILRSDGGMILIAESNYVTEASNYNSYYQLYTITYTYHYDNVLLLSVNPDGTLDWGNVLRKSQSSENDDAFFSSYALFAAENLLTLIYNKSIRRKTDIIKYSIDSHGVSSEISVLSGNEEVMLMPKSCKQVSAQQMIIPCIEKGRPGLLKLSF